MVAHVNYRVLVPATLTPQALATVAAILDHGGHPHPYPHAHYGQGANAPGLPGSASNPSNVEGGAAGTGAGVVAGVAQVIAGLTEQDIDDASHQIVQACTGPSGPGSAGGAVVTLHGWDLPEGCGDDIAHTTQVALALLSQTAPFVVIEFSVDGPGRRITHTPDPQPDEPDEADEGCGSGEVCGGGGVLRGPQWHEVACDAYGQPVLTAQTIEAITGDAHDHTREHLVSELRQALGADLPVPAGMAPTTRPSRS